MTGQDAELSLAAQLRNAAYQLQIYEAITAATSDAHGTLDAIMGASDPDAARQALQRRHGFTDVQALAVMDMQFRRVTALDREKIELRCQELVTQVRLLEERLGGS